MDIAIPAMSKTAFERITGILIINQNYDKSWRSDSAKPLSRNGLLAVNLDKTGEYLVSFNYVPISFYAGLGVSMVTLVLMIYYLGYRKV